MLETNWTSGLLLSLCGVRNKAATACGVGGRGEERSFVGFVICEVTEISAAVDESPPASTNPIRVERTSCRTILKSQPF